MNTKNVDIFALSPLDGRYFGKTKELREYFSEFALIRNRLQVEVRYLLLLSKYKVAPPYSADDKEKLMRLVVNFLSDQARQVKMYEKKIRHDVKAVEYFLRDFMNGHKIPGVSCIHFGLTSEDVNSIAIGLSLRQALDEQIIPSLDSLLGSLADFSDKYVDTPMLARTHGQPAVPTTMGKEMMVFADRLRKQLVDLRSISIEAKCSGAVGNFNAHHLVNNEFDWGKLSNELVSSFDLEPNMMTTQIVPADSYVRVFGCLQRINMILLDMSGDMWRYISDGYLLQKKMKNEVGSSTMPQKINPIDFENAEGNLGMSNALLTHFIHKLPISRLQRDLSGSTVRRNFGVALGHALLAYQSLLVGLSKISVDEKRLFEELDSHWEILSEGVQTVLRAQGDDRAYERVREYFQGEKIDGDTYKTFVSSLEISDEVKEKLLSLTPHSYVGRAKELTLSSLKQIKKY